MSYYPNDMDELIEVLGMVRRIHGRGLDIRRNPVGNLNVFMNNEWLGWIDLGPNGPRWEPLEIEGY
jgi:hypothetical protein